MIDGHVHFHGQPYTLETIDNMMKVALEKGVTELYLLDHTHKFYEFDFLYTSLKEERTVNWFYNIETKHIKNHLQEYIDFIKEVRKHSYPVKLHFGLEVCYFKDKMDQFKETLEGLKPFEFDFLLGSIHYVDSMCVDLCESIYHDVDLDRFYQTYFDDMFSMIKSKMFTFIAHPDLFKLFKIYPSFDLTPYYEELGELLKEYDIETENSSGLLRYHYDYPGLSPELLKIFDKHGVKYHRSSDAHVYTDIGKAFDQLKSTVD